MILSVFVVFIVVSLMLYVFSPLVDIEDFFRVSVETVDAKYEDVRFIEGILNE